MDNGLWREYAPDVDGDGLDAAMLIAGYPAEKLEWYADARGGFLSLCGDYACARMADDEAFNPVWAFLAARPGISTVWVPHGQFCGLLEQRRVAFRFGRAAARGARDARVVELVPGQARLLVEARDQVPEFTAWLAESEAWTLLSAGIWRVFGVLENGRLLSSAAAVRIEDNVYKVQSVMTITGARRRGLSRAVLQTLMAELAGAKLLLMYEVPEAGALYHSLGFEDFARMDMVEVRRERNIWL